MRAPLVWCSDGAQISPIATRLRNARTTSPLVRPPSTATTSATRRTPCRRSASSVDRARAVSRIVSTVVPSPPRNTLTPLANVCSPAARSPKVNGGCTNATTTSATATLRVTLARLSANTAAAINNKSRWRVRNSPSGACAAARATLATHQTSARVGRCTIAANGPPTMPASTPAVRPHIMIGPAAGAARMLAGSAARGMPPKRATSIGATATCAAIVTDAPSANHLGPGSRDAIDGASSTMPAVASSDS